MKLMAKIKGIVSGEEPASVRHPETAVIHGSDEDEEQPDADRTGKLPASFRGKRR